MKKLFLSLLVAAFAVAAQAGDDSACAQQKSSCCAQKAKQSQAAQQSQSTCPVTGKPTSCPMAKKNAEKQNVSAKQTLKSPKSASSAKS